MANGRRERAANYFVTHYLHSQHPPKKEGAAADYLILSQWAKSFQRVCLCVGVSLCKLYLAIICQQRASHTCEAMSWDLSFSLPTITVTISIIRENAVLVDLSHTVLPRSLCYFTGACSQSGWYGDHFVVGDVGKRMEGALAPLWEQAWGNGPLRSPYIYTHT